MRNNAIGDEWKVVSDNAKDLISKILCPADKRLKAAEILEHPWMKEPGKTDDQPLPVKFGSLKYFRNAEKLKKAALTFIATQCNEEEIGEMSKIFQSLDTNGDGVLTLDELKAGNASIGSLNKACLNRIIGIKCKICKGAGRDFQKC